MSNDSDLRAAAERLKRLDAGETNQAVYRANSADAANRMLVDLSKLANAHMDYLSSQPADGEEAITEETEPVEYVDALGLRSRWCIARWTDGRYVLVLDQSDNDGPLNLDECDCVLFPVATNHDVRRLCGVLGISLKETTT